MDEKSSCLNCAHVISAKEHPHSIVESPFCDAMIIHCTQSNVFIVEYEGTNYDELCAYLKTLPIIRLQTTNQEIYKRLIPDFKEHYSCYQVVYPVSALSEGTVLVDNPSDENLCLLKKEDLPYVQKSYEMPDYMQQLYDRNRVYGWYEADELVGYVAFHIDETVGALFVKPEYRKKGYGSKIMAAAFRKYNDGIRYSQIICDNKASVEMHKKIGCDFEDKLIYWVYDEEYTYS